MKLITIAAIVLAQTATAQFVSDCECPFKEREISFPTIFCEEGEVLWLDCVDKAVAAWELREKNDVAASCADYLHGPPGGDGCIALEEERDIAQALCLLGDPSLISECELLAESAFQDALGELEADLEVTLVQKNHSNDGLLAYDMGRCCGPTSGRQEFTVECQGLTPWEHRYVMSTSALGSACKFMLPEPPVLDCPNGGPVGLECQAIIDWWNGFDWEGDLDRACKTYARCDQRYYDDDDCPVCVSYCRSRVVELWGDLVSCRERHVQEKALKECCNQ